jgi:hypothetical protein
MTSVSQISRSRGHSPSGSRLSEFTDSPGDHSTLLAGLDQLTDAEGRLSIEWESLLLVASPAVVRRWWPQPASGERPLGIWNGAAGGILTTSDEYDRATAENAAGKAMVLACPPSSGGPPGRKQIWTNIGRGKTHIGVTSCSRQDRHGQEGGTAIHPLIGMTVRFPILRQGLSGS